MMNSYPDYIRTEAHEEIIDYKNDTINIRDSCIKQLVRLLENTELNDKQMEEFLLIKKWCNKNNIF